jgi:hypothetical protein
MKYTGRCQDGFNVRGYERHERPCGELPGRSLCVSVCEIRTCVSSMACASPSTRGRANGEPHRTSTLAGGESVISADI